MASIFFSFLFFFFSFFFFLGGGGGGGEEEVGGERGLGKEWGWAFCPDPRKKTYIPSLYSFP